MIRPAFVVLPDPRGLPPGGPVNWGAGFLPAAHQGTSLELAPGRAPIADLFPPEEFSRGPDGPTSKPASRPMKWRPGCS